MDTKSDDKAQVEVRVRTDIYDRALSVARSQGISLAAIARTIIFATAAEVREQSTQHAPPEAEREGRLPLRKYGEKRTVMRFTIPRDQFIAAKADISRSGRTLSAAVEDGLREYAEKRTTT